MVRFQRLSSILSVIVLVTFVDANIRYYGSWNGQDTLKVSSISTTKIENRNLQLTAIKTILTPANVSVCEEECTKTTGCISFNTVEMTDSDTIKECQLLDKDHFSYPFDLIIANGNFHVVYVSPIH